MIALQLSYAQVAHGLVAAVSEQENVDVYSIQGLGNVTDVWLVGFGKESNASCWTGQQNESCFLVLSCVNSFHVVEWG
jgi:hypothetical protein